MSAGLVTVSQSAIHKGVSHRIAISARQGGPRRWVLTSKPLQRILRRAIASIQRPQRPLGWRIRH
ncbi:hypothetical protein [Novosphingobium sp. AAP83]|uniref:hypothetical protein n=1 Tax=Novosphingobium sp. AAP83 TaxID=1523425 RepID=UPI0012F7329E|nr:hypothetical protein [Novosphingobium sp. AAP83]